MKINNDIIYVGVNDREIDLFEGQYIVENGMAYNSYVIMDDKIAVMDTVDKNFGTEWLNNIGKLLEDRKPDYLVIQHMEPDHSSNIDKFMEKYPNAVIVATAKSFVMIKQYFGTDYKDNQMVVTDGNNLELGKHTLSFFTAPMVHWPEVMVSYDSYSGVLFSADAFGKFGTWDTDEEWACEARRYYFGIVGKYGAQVQMLLKKLSGVTPSVICPLHGPVLTDNLDYYINLYDIWSSYKPEEDGVAIAYTSVYGNTEKAVKLLEEELKKKGVKVAVSNLARCDVAEAVEDAFKFSKLVLATTTYNASVFPFMKEFIDHLTERNYQNRKIGIIENGSWAPVAEKVIKQLLEKSKDIEYTDTTVRIFSAVNSQNIDEITKLANELA